MTNDNVALTGRFSATPAPMEGRRLMALPGIISVIAALVTAAVSFVILTGLTPIAPNERTTLVLVAVNAALILLLFLLIFREIYRIVAARKWGKAASRLHVRIVLLFSLVAAVPAFAVAVVASITLDIGLDRWFELRTKTIVSSSISVAQAYVEENARNLQGTTLSMAFDLDQQRSLFNLDRFGFQNLLDQQAVGRALAGAALLRADGTIVMKAKVRSDIPLPKPPIEALQTAADGQPVLIPPRFRNLVGAIVKTRELSGLYLYTIRVVDSEVIKARNLIAENAAEYQGLEENRTTTQIAFALLYLGMTMTVLLSAIWTGIAVADRLVRPIRQLISAADDVATGNLDVSVPVRNTDGDVASLGDTFNKMIFQLKSQRDEILKAKDQVDERRRFSEAVLSGVTAGVIGVEPDGRISIANRSAKSMLGIDANKHVGKQLSEVLAPIDRVFENALESGRLVHREQVTFYRAGTERTFNVQITVEEGSDEEHSYVVTVDDITDLLLAQRSTAWADVARRIAHEIKNPLTPIQLSAERIRRRYGKVITEDREVFDQCTDTIIRQVGDIGRMVDEFSAFARMPKPTMEITDLRDALKEASFLVEVSRSEITFMREFGDEPLMGRFDSRLISQAFGNIIKNAAESVEAAMRDGQNEGVVRISAGISDNRIVVDVTDNGKGLPRKDRQRLLEPYMTTRDKGTGLGLAIVRKIIEDHDGKLELHDAPKEFHGGKGALIRMTFAVENSSQASAKEDRNTEKVENGV